MKLNYKRTILVGFAFFLICAFWQAYDATIPVILTNKYGMSQFWSGVIMALDNVLALFLLPLFGSLSDKCKSKHGKRTPFIVVGTTIAAIALICLSFADYAQLKNISAVSAIDDPAAMETIYDAKYDEKLTTPDGKKFVLSDRFDKETFSAIKCQISAVDVDDLLPVLDKYNILTGKTEGESFILTDDFSAESFDRYLGQISDESTASLLRLIYDYEVPVTVYEDTGYIVESNLSEEAVTAFREYLGKDDITTNVTHPYYANYVVPARQSYVADVTDANPGPLIWFVSLLLVLLLAMSVFRSPAVALMPDVTVKPLRSKANAVINLMGSAGGIIVLLLGMIMATSAVQNQLMNYIVYYLIIALLMVGSLAIFIWKVREKEWARQMESDTIRYGIEEKEETPTQTRELCKDEKKSMLLILLSVALWYFGYNAVTSKYSVYAQNVLYMDYNFTMILAQGAAIVAYLPAGMIASKIGRKKTIIAGVIILSLAFGVASFIGPQSPVLLVNILFAAAGVGWATINVNSFPMAVELSSGANVGKYTGYYYTASMAAQTLTPMFSGWLMDTVADTILFPYAAIFVALAIVTMMFVTHGDNKVATKKGLEAFDIED